jgi:hypothetical protein
MATWKQIETEAPELAARARRIFDAYKHKTLATLRRDGSPRISGCEIMWRDGEMWFGSMPRAVKALDLRRDPRFALHSASDESNGWEADAKVAGRAEEIEDPDVRKALLGGMADGGAHLFRGDLDELVVVGLNEARNRLVIESWHEGRGVERLERD